MPITATAAEAPDAPFPFFLASGQPEPPPPSNPPMPPADPDAPTPIEEPPGPIPVPGAPEPPPMQVGAIRSA